MEDGPETKMHPNGEHTFREPADGMNSTTGKEEASTVETLFTTVTLEDDVAGKFDEPRPAQHDKMQSNVPTRTAFDLNENQRDILEKVGISETRN